MEVNFGRSPEFSLGVEEEFQILHGESYELASRFSDISEAAGGDKRIKPELLQSVVETSTRVCTTVAEAVDDARALRLRLRDAAEERGLLIASAGTHPFSLYQHQEVTGERRYQEIADAMQWVAERELVFGLHVHVGVGSADKAIAVANVLRTHLPEFLALSVNSPYWQARDTGLASARTKVFETMPRSGLPPAFSSFSEFERLVERGVKTNSFRDYSYIWWDLRPHPRLGTIEVRICDAQTRLEATGAIAALVQSLVAALSDRYEAGAPLEAEPHLLIAENKWRATRYGLESKLIALDRDEERPARAAIRSLLDFAEPAAVRLGCARELAEVERFLERGSGTDEQRQIHAETGSLLAVARWLVEHTVEGPQGP